MCIDVVTIEFKDWQVVREKAGGLDGRLAVRSAAGAPPVGPPTHKMYRQHRRRQKAIVRNQQLNQRKRSAYSRQFSSSSINHANFQQQRLARIETARHKSRRKIQSVN
ncbi:unnamed protein product [Mesocestoides corti]|uniref:BZIP domain-containing protein n=1 Tax=Mesocestoides corti TaxID=53468 RepID=A0A0R3UR28_MESCO|nr:unnamed protein product [Mesocestoides corti]